MKSHNYFVYIITNKAKTVLYTGVTNSLERRLFEHSENTKYINVSFAGRYNCQYLVYWEWFQWIQNAIDREKEIKRWRREKKVKLITDFNPNWKFLNDELP